MNRSQRLSRLGRSGLLVALAAAALVSCGGGSNVVPLEQPAARPEALNASKPGELLAFVWDRVEKRWAAGLSGAGGGLYVTTDDQIDGQPGEPFNILFNPDVQRLALRPKAEDESGTQTSSVVGLNDEHWVEVAGIEPASDDVIPGLLRAQCAREFLGPRARAHAFPDRPSRVDVPRRPPT